jgi:lipoprotein signal peptidase
MTLPQTPAVPHAAALRARPDHEVLDDSTFPPPWRAPGKNIAVIEDVFHLVRVHNQGVAFGFGNGTAWAPVVFLIVPLIALTLIRIFWKKGVFQHPLSMIAVALLLCGIFGNLTDRLIQGFCWRISRTDRSGSACLKVMWWISSR